MYRTITIWLAIINSTIFVTCCEARDVESIEIPNAAINAWRSRSKELSSVNLYSTENYKWLKEERRRLVKHKLQGRNACVLYSYDSMETTSSERIERVFRAAINNQYGFALGGDGGDDIRYQILYLGKRKDIEDRVRNDILERQCLMVGGMIYLDSLLDIVNSKGFVLLSTTKNKDAGTVDFAFRSDGSLEDHYDLVGGRFSVLPKLSWSLASFDVEILFADGPGFVVGNCAYSKNTLAGIPVPERQEIEILDGNRNSLLHRTAQFSLTKSDTVTCEQCSLSEFGFPEPGMSAKEHSGLAWWLIGINMIAVILIGGGVLIKRLFRQ